MAYVTENMIQYTVDEAPKLLVTPLSSLDVTWCGSTGIGIITEYNEEYPYSVLFGDIITHRFKTTEALRDWNNNYNSIMVAIPIGMAITQLEERSVWLRKEKQYANNNL